MKEAAAVKENEFIATDGTIRKIYKPSVWHEIKKNKTSYLMIAPFALLFIFFTVLPVLCAIGLSFTYFNMLEMPTFTGWSNYIRLFLDDEIFVIALKNTLIFAFLTGPISYFMCLFLAWFINELPPKVRAVMTFVFYAPSISGNLYMMWAFIFSGDQYGMLNSFLIKYGIVQEPIKWLTDANYVLGVIIIVQLWLSLGAAFLSFIAGLQGIDKNMYEAGAIDGIRNRWQELIYLTLPSMGPQLMFGAVMQISSSFSVAAVSTALAGNPSTDYAAHTIVNHITDYGTVRFEMGYASAIAVVLFAMMVACNYGVRAIIKRFADQGE